MSAQPAIVPTTRPRWTPVVVPGTSAPTRAVAAADVDIAPGEADVTTAAAAGPPGTPPDAAVGAAHRLAPPTRAAAWRRRAAAASIPLLLALALTGLFGGGTADAGPTDPVAGSVTLQPGDTLWDVAATTAPDGTDTRDQLARILLLNGFDSDEVQPWTVVLLPAR